VTVEVVAKKVYSAILEIGKFNNNNCPKRVAVDEAHAKIGGERVFTQSTEVPLDIIVSVFTPHIVVCTDINSQ